MAGLAELGTPFDFYGKVTIRPSEIELPLTLRVELVLALIIGDSVCPESQYKPLFARTLLLGHCSTWNTLLGSLAAGPLRGSRRVGSLWMASYYPRIALKPLCEAQVTQATRSIQPFVVHVW
jgi:hypothetical protein